MSKIEKNITCIICPQGCSLKITGTKNNLVVEGGNCQKGVDYAIEETTSPKRVLTSSCKLVDGALPVVSVKTLKPIPKQKISEAMEEIKKHVQKAPVKVGDVLVADLCSTGVSLVCTKTVGVKII
jgi:CxxC motif-containing protein